MSILNTKQVSRLLIASSDSILPLWRVLPFRQEGIRNILRSINFILVFLFAFIIVFLGELSPFPTHRLLSHDAGRIVTYAQEKGINVTLLYAKSIGVVLLVSSILWAFLIDLKDALSGQLSNRFHYYDPEHSTDTTLWWTVVILLSGYVVRIWLFGICFLIGSKTANTFSIVYSGFTVFSTKTAELFSVRSPDLLLVALQNPLGFGDVSGGGTWQSMFVVAFLCFSRITLITFLLGVFGLVLRRMPSISSFQPSEESILTAEPDKKNKHK